MHASLEATQKLNRPTCRSFTESSDVVHQSNMAAIDVKWEVNKFYQRQFHHGQLPAGPSTQIIGTIMKITHFIKDDPRILSTMNISPSTSAVLVSTALTLSPP